MSTTEQPGAGWWLASDGNWYPPQTAEHHEPEPPRKRRVWPWVVGGIAVVVVLLGLAAPDPESESASPPESTTTTVATTETTNIVGSYIELGAPGNPTVEQAQEIEALVAEVYSPDIRGGRSTNWAASTCEAIRSGRDGVTHAQGMFAGGSRPDPTPEQAQAIVDLIVTQGWCV